ncbi:protein OSCP1-like [Eriocheir sinensis]|uniref:protein OSCP1-like n=1 Tax=Eriocheir sinensis TaxID=95602 RepID=UPI0021CA98F5|nr:protein OSCP1-like [Eriocheir sinensis]
MSLRALPLQFLNLGGEMMYVIDQRLRAQAIPENQATKVRNDIISIMLNRRFVEEVFSPQELYSSPALRTVFDKLAHASIMRLNPSSMDKLFDLMVMAVKQQMLSCRSPREVLLVTLNHLDALRGYATYPQAAAQVEASLNLFRQTYVGLPEGQVWAARLAILGFVQDMKIRVSVFLKQSLQTPTGTLALPPPGPVPQGSEVPGVVRVMADQVDDVEVVIYRFPAGGDYLPPTIPGSLDLQGYRGTTLGTNMYTVSYEDGSVAASTTQSFAHHPSQSNSDAEVRGTSKGSGMDELNLLVQLIGRAPTNKKEFRLNLFPSEEDEEGGECAAAWEGSGYSTITIEGRRRGPRTELGQILSELSDLSDLHNESQEDKGQDLLDLMDSL